MKTFVLKIILLVCFIVPALVSCGGGGGTGEFLGAADVQINAEPRKVDTGDRTKVTVQIQSAHPDGIALKIRFPSNMAYVPNTAIITIDGSDLDIGPEVNAASSTESYTYLVFYFSEALFGHDNRGELTLQLEGSDEVKDGRLEVDADVDDPLVSNDSEFNIESPEFLAEDQVKIEVLG